MGLPVQNTGGRYFEIDQSAWFTGPDVVRDYVREYRVRVWGPGYREITFVTRDPLQINRIKAQAVYHGGGVWQFLAPKVWRSRMHECLVYLRGAQRFWLRMDEIHRLRMSGYAVEILK